MKILHVIEDVSSHSGGPSVSAISLAAALTNVDKAIGVICYEKDGHDTTITNSRAYPGFEKVNWYIVPKGGCFEFLFAPKFCRALLKVVPDYDVVSIHGSWLPALIQAGVVSLLYRKPYIVVPHGMLDTWTLAYKKWKKFFVWHLCWKWIVNHSNMIRALTSDEKDLMKQIGITAPIEVVPNGVFSSQYNALKSIDDSIYERSELSTLSKPYVLFLSRIHYKKGLDILINAFSLVVPVINNLTLVIAGPDENYWPEMQALIDRHNLNDRVLYVGPVYGDDKYRLLKHAACFCLPSRQEGFSMAIIEAMSVGTPVIISEDCHFNEILDKNAGLVTSLDEKEVANAIISVVNDQDTAKEMGVNGSELIRNEYTWEALAVKHNNFIKMHL